MIRGKIGMVGLLFTLAACITVPEAPPPRPDVHIRNGIKLLKRGNCQAAQEQFEKAVRTDPDNFRAHFGLGASALVCHKPGKAVRELKIALRLAPSPRWKDRIRTLLAVARAEHPGKRRKHHHARMRAGVDLDLIIVWMEE